MRMIDRIALCSTCEQLNALVPEILTYDDEVPVPVRARILVRTASVA